VCVGGSYQGVEKFKGISFSRIDEETCLGHSHIARKLLILKSVVRKVTHLVRQEKFDVIRPISLVPALASLIATRGRSRAPIVANLSDFYSDLCRQLMIPAAPIVSHLVEAFERKVIRESDAVIVDSPIQRAYWGHWGLDEKRCSVVPHGIPRSYDGWRDSHQQVQELRNLNEPGTEDRNSVLPPRSTSPQKVVLYVGDISRMDGLDVLIAASPRIKKEINDVLFVIVGQGPPKYFQYLQRLVSVAGMTPSFLHIPKILNDHLPHLVSRADVCVAPFRIALTSNSSVPNKILEYIAVERPIVCSKGAGVQQMLGVYSGGTIRYVTPESSSDLADGITTALCDEDSKLVARRELAPIIQALNWRRIMRREEEVIEAVVGGTELDLRVFDYQVL
jgi:glycosyltransferase involved in cell wall biosynthesis